MQRHLLQEEVKHEALVRYHVLPQCAILQPGAVSFMVLNKTIIDGVVPDDNVDIRPSEARKENGGKH